MVTKEDNPTKEQQAVIGKVAKWIDSSVMAEVIAEELVDHNMPVTLENMKAVWLNILECALHDDAGYAIEAIRTGWKP